MHLALIDHWSIADRHVLSPSVRVNTLLIEFRSIDMYSLWTRRLLRGRYDRATVVRYSQLGQRSGAERPRRPSCG